MEISFSAFEFHQDEKFHKTNYRYEGSVEKGWNIYRNDKLFQTLGPGYVLLKSLYCGICSTDIYRANLPFPLPQITGHEVVALLDETPVAIDINASHFARGIENAHCPYCEMQLYSHCKERLTLGIDRLPGGFSPYLLAPRNAIFPLPDNLDPLLAVVAEPLAAALHAVENMQIEDDMHVAVVGPKRLGLLLVLALNLNRMQKRQAYSITAVVRRSELLKTSMLFGADEALLAHDVDNEEFDVVYDTTGSVSGFSLSMALAKNAVHVKSTHGLVVDEFSGMTQLVIDELSLFPLKSDQLQLLKDTLDDSEKLNVFVGKDIPQKIVDWVRSSYPEKNISQCDLTTMGVDEVGDLTSSSRFKKFDVAIVSSMWELNRLMDFPELHCLVRPCGHIYWFGDAPDNSIWTELFRKNIVLRSSRCGSIAKALTLMSENMEKIKPLMSDYISEVYGVDEIGQAFEAAKSKKGVKLVIKHEWR